MKIVLVGTTGLIGTAILRRVLEVSEITSIITLSRRELPAELGGVSTKDSRIKNMIVADFEEYSPEVLAELNGAEACIWSLGGRLPQFPDFDTARKANVTYPHAGAESLASNIAPSVSPTSPGKKFRFVYCSGMFSEHDQGKKLYFMKDSRKLKGLAESGLIEISRKHEETFELLIARPAGVLETDKGLSSAIYGSMGIGKEVLAAAMVDLALKGAKEQMTESADLRTRGREVLKQ